MKKQNSVYKVKKAINEAKEKYDITHLTIICGYKALYSGVIDNFFSNCDINMVVYRNELLEREIIGKDILNNNKLFLFISDAEEEN